ncbi:MAG: M18 family aminopeptidase [Clostridium sp.]|nr:M18 family aminopeptidase [Clostridium sp.]
MNEKDFGLDLIDFLHESPTAYNAVELMKKDLIKEGYIELKGNEKWNLKVGDKVFYLKNSSAIFVLNIGESPLDKGFKIMGAHTDSPSFRIKPNSEMISEGFLKLNVETYGGPILSTWFDRPLSLAGRVSIKSDNPLYPINKVVDLKDPILYIPSVAIHMNRQVNDGVKIDKQKHVLPIVGLSENLAEGKDKEKGFIKNLLAENLKVKAGDILDFDLFAYEVEKGSFVGINEEFISSKRQDNLGMVHCGLEAIKRSSKFSGINIAAFFDNEECGSSSKQGADSPLLRNLMERVYFSLGGDREGFLRSLESSFMISADLAHSIHPNYSDYHDPTNRPIINKGPVIKVSANQSYTSDSDSSGAFISLCEKAGVPYQFFVNRSDLRGGSTIGPIGTTHLPIRTIDIGNAILGMHSIRELSGAKDHLYLYKVLVEYFNLL